MDKKIVKSILGVSMISFFGKFFGLFRESALAKYYGVTNTADAFKIAYLVPDILFLVLSTSIAAAFIPILSEIRAKGDDKLESKFITNIVSIFIVISVLLIILGLVFTREIVNIISPGMNDNTLMKTVMLARIIFPASVFLVLSNFYSGYLQINKKYTIAATVWYPHNILIIIGIVVSAYYGLYLLGVFTALGIIAMLLIQIPSVIKSGYKFGFFIDLQNVYLLKMVKLIIPIILGTTINQIYTIAIRIVASKLGEGNISAFDYAARLSSLVFSIVIFSISTVIFSELSSVAHEFEIYKNLLVKTVRSILIVIIPLMILLVILKERIVGIIFQHGIFTYNDTLLVSKIFFWLTLGLIGMSIREILYKALYALKDTKTPLVVETIYLFLCIFLIFILSKVYGIQGVAISISTTSTLNVLSLIVIFKMKYNIDMLKDTMTIILKTGVISVIFLICVFILSKFSILNLHGQQSFLQNIFVSIQTGFLFIFIYSIGLYLMRIDEICKAVDIIKIRLKKCKEKIS